MKKCVVVNRVELEIVNPKGKIPQRFSFITDLPVDRDTVADLAACGRTRWKIENETFNVLKNQGYHLEHNFGHGKETLASVLVVLNLLAFALHTGRDLTEAAWQRAHERFRARIRMFTHLATITAYHVFPSWSALMRTLTTGAPPPQPP